MNKFQCSGKVYATIHLLVILVLAVLDMDARLENETLLVLLNTLFIGAVPLTVAAVAGYTYVQKYNAGILLMSCGMLAIGLGSVTGGLLWVYPVPENVPVTVYNSCALYGAVFHLAASIKERAPKPEKANVRKMKLVMAFLGTCLFVIAVWMVSLFGWLPPFIDENGSTRIRDIVLWLSVAFYFGAFIEMSRQGKRGKPVYIRWYSMSLLMISAGLFGVWLARGTGTLLGWAGRAAQYTGVVFALFSMVSVILKAKRQGDPLAEIMAEFFAADQDNYKNLAELSAGAVIAVDEDFHIFFANTGAAPMFRFGKNEILHASFLSLLPEPYKSRVRQDFLFAIDLGRGGLQNPVEMEASDREGRRFPVEISASYRTISSGHVCTYVIKDITERKQAEEKIRRQNEALRAINKIYEYAINCDTVDGLAQACLQVAQAASGSCCGFIAEVDGKGLMHMLAANHHRDGHGSFMHEPNGAMQHIPRQLQEVFRIILDRGEPLLTKLQMGPPEGALTHGDVPAITFLGVPIRRNGKTEGMLGVGNRNGGYTEEDKYVLTELTPTIFEALQNKRSEEKLQDSEERFGAFMNAGPFIAQIQDEEGCFVFANRKWETESGRLLGDAIGRTNTDLLPEDIARKVMENHEAVKKTGKAIHDTLWIGKAGGIKCCFESIWFPFASKSGQTFVGSITIDITDQKLAEEALRHNESLLQAILEGTDDPVFLKDTGSRILMGNRALSLVMGMPISQIIGKTDTEIYGDHEKAMQLVQNDRQVLTSLAHQSIEEIIPASEGERTYLTAKTPWFDEKGNVLGIIGIAQDITDRKAMEMELKRKTRELEEKNRLITDFFINISHEFKTPLSIIVLLADLLGQLSGNMDSQSEDFARFVKMLRVNAYRLRRLVANLLDITKLDAGFMEPQWEHVDVVALLESVVASTGVYARQKGLTLSFSSTVKQLRMSADSLMLERILMNLLSNAMKHTLAGGAISVDFRAFEDKVTITVTDNGEGIPEEKKSVIFDRFRQVNTSLARTSEGCGIGLSISKALAELLQGSIAFQSELGMGSAFTVTLPVLHLSDAGYAADFSGMGLDSRIQMELSDIDFG